MTPPLVSVVIPVFGKSNLVVRCIDSLRRQKRLEENGVVIIDDASPENDREVINTISGIRVFRNNGNSGFVKSVNRGIKKTDSKYVLILNSDTEAYDDRCIENMAQNLDDGAAVCGALLLYPKTDPYRAERIQHAGVYFGVDKFPVHIMSGWHAATPAANVRRSVPAVTGACFMITREWWNKMGGWDTRFGMGVFEDVSLCLSIRKMGGEIIYEPKSVWAHYEHSSQEQGTNWFSREHVNENFQYLLLKHGNIEPSDRYWFKGV